MKELAAHKRLLVLESELNRQALRTHCSNVQDRLGRAERFIQVGRTVSPLLLAAVSAGSFFMFSKRKAITGIAGKALFGWQLLRTLKPLWTAFADKRSSSGSSAAEA